MGESRAGAPRGEGVIIRGTGGGGSGAAPSQMSLCEPGATASSSPEPLERRVCSSLGSEVAPHAVHPRLGQEKPFLDHPGPSLLPAWPVELLMVVAEGQSEASGWLWEEAGRP